MSPRAARLAPLLGAALALGGALLAWLPRSYPVQLLGTTALLGGIWLLLLAAHPLLKRPLPWRRGSERAAGVDPTWTWGRLLLEAAGPVILLALLVALYSQLLGGAMPWQADHTVHEWKAWLLSEKLLPSGRISGWTHQSGAGYPAEVLYPPLGDYWMGLVRHVTFKALSWEATYALGFFGVLAFCVGAFYHMGRRLFGPLAGLVAALFVLTDMGGFREGGYIFTVRYGVWPLHLGVTLGFLALLELHLLLSARGWRHLLRCGAATGAALLAHPVSLIFLLVALPLYLLLRFLRGARGDERILGKTLAGLGLGLGLAAYWLLPFFHMAPGFSSHVTNQWKPISDIADGILAADLWRNAWAWPLIMGVLGGILSLRDRHPFASYLFALSGVLLLAGSLTTYNELRLDNWIASARFVQFQRFVIFVKLIWFLLAGFLVQRLLVRSPVVPGPGPGAPTPEELGESGPPPTSAGGDAVPSRWSIRRAGLVAVVCLLAAPFVLPICWSLAERRLLPVGQVVNVRDKGPFLRDFRSLLSRVCSARRDPGAGFFRLGYLSSFNDHEMASGATYCDVPEVKLSFIPSETFKYRANLSPSAVPRTREDLAALNVRFLITNGTRQAPRWAREVARRGRLALYELDDYRPERYTVLRRVLDSSGASRYERVDPAPLGISASFQDERITIRAKEAGPNLFLVLHVAHFAAWSARRGDKELQIHAYDDLAPRVRGLMMVPLRTGTTVFTYRLLWADYLGRLLTLLALLSMGIILLGRRRPQLIQPALARIRPLVRRLAPWGRRLVIALGVATTALLLAKASGLLGRSSEPRSLTHEIGNARVAVRLRDGQIKRCNIFQMGRWICGKGRRWVGPVAEEWNLLNRFGLWAHPDERGTLVISFPGQRLGRSLEISYGVLQSGGVGAPVTLDVFVDERRVAQVRWPRVRGRPSWAPRPLVIDTRKWKGRRAKVRFEVSTTNIGGRHFAFDARILP